MFAYWKEEVSVLGGISVLLRQHGLMTWDNTKRQDYDLVRWGINRKALCRFFGHVLQIYVYDIEKCIWIFLAPM